MAERKNRIRRWEKAALLAFVFCVLWSLMGFFAECSGICGKVLRMHVVANSDSAADQALKLQVRDAVVDEGAVLLENVTEKEQAQEILAAHLPQLQLAAQSEVYAQGYEYPVEVLLTEMYFPTRQYETVTLPAGRYDAVRVNIGEHAGQNWWCVIFPALCLPVAAEKQELADVLNAEQLKIVSDAPSYEVGFKTVEWFEKLRSWLQEN